MAGKCRICLEEKSSCASLYQMVRENYLPAVIEYVCNVQISVDVEPDAQACMECAMAMIQAETIIKKFYASNKKIQQENKVAYDIENQMYEVVLAEEFPNEEIIYDSEQDDQIEEYSKDQAEVYIEEQSGGYKEEHAIMYAEGLTEVYEEQQSRVYAEVQTEAYDEQQSEVYAEVQTEAYDEQQSKVYAVVQTEACDEQQPKMYSELQTEAYNEQQSKVYAEVQTEAYEEQQKNKYLEGITVQTEAYLEDPTEEYSEEYDYETGEEKVVLSVQSNPSVQNVDVDVVAESEYFSVFPMDSSSLISLEATNLPQAQTVIDTPKAVQTQNESLRNAAKRRKVQKPRTRVCMQFSCEHCEYQTLEIKEYREHIEREHGVSRNHETFKCCYCSSVFEDRTQLKDHLETFHLDNLKNMKFVCTDCGRGFSKQFHYLQHAFVHNPEQRRHRCEFCQKAFGNARGLKFHVDSCHSEKRPYECEICKKSFGVQTYLVNHIKRVHGPKSYTCPKCQETFTQSKELDYHLLNVCPVLYKNSTLS